MLPPRPLEPKSGVRAKVVAEWAPAKKRERRAPSDSKQRREEYAREMEEMRESGEWKALAPGHAVALYAACHQRCYGVGAAELDRPREFAQARMAAARLLRAELAGDAESMVDFLRWSWVREEERERWRRAQGRGGGRLGWRLQFGGSLLSEYRVAKARGGSGGDRGR